MRLLLDQNLSPALPRLLADVFPQSLHTDACGLGQVGDETIWNFAKSDGLLIVSKDSDFRVRSLLHGFPPKVIWLRIGNCPTREVENVLRTNSAAIHTFGEHPEEPLLILSKK